MAAKKKSAVVMVRAKQTTAFPPMTLGYSSLVKPDEYEGERKFNMDGHLNAAALEATKTHIAEKCYCEKLIEELKEAAEENSIPWKEPQDAGEWLQAKLKEPKETFSIQMPFLRFVTKASFKGRDGDMVEKTMSAWDSKNKPLNLKALRLGRGSIVQPVIRPCLFLSKLIGFPQPKLDLVGVRVLDLVQFGGGGQAPEELDEAALKEIMAEVEVDDLSAYALGAVDPATAAEPPSDGVRF